MLSRMIMLTRMDDGLGIVTTLRIILLVHVPSWGSWVVGRPGRQAGTGGMTRAPSAPNLDGTVGLSARGSRSAVDPVGLWTTLHGWTRRSATAVWRLARCPLQRESYTPHRAAPTWRTAGYTAYDVE